MNIDTIMTLVLILMFVVIAGIVLYSFQDYISLIDHKVNDLKNDYVPKKDHDQEIRKSKKEDNALHERIDTTDEKIAASFDGNYNNLQNKPDLFDGEYASLNNKPDLFDGKYDSLDNKPDLFDGNYNNLKNKPDLFDGEYDSLNNKPDLFDGNYSKLTNKPKLFDGDYSKLTNQPTLFDGKYSSLNDKPILFDGKYGSLTEIPNKFPSEWNQIDGKPDKFDTSWDKVDGKPDAFNTKWSMIDDKPVKFSSAWDSIDDKPDKFPTQWDLIEGKPPIRAPSGPNDTWDKSEIKKLLDEKASKQHTHIVADIQGFDSNVSTMITDYTARFALVNHNHDVNQINGLSGQLDDKQDKLIAGNNISIVGNTISSQQANLTDYTTTTELASRLANKQDKFTAGNNISIDGDIISASQPDLSGYATTTELASELANKQATITNSTDLSVKSITARNINTNGHLATSSFELDTNKFQITDHTDYRRIQTHDGKPLVINSLGNNVGIGTTEPKTKLEVAGNLKVNGNINGLTQSDINNLKALLQYLNKYPDLQVAFGDVELSNRQLQCYLDRYPDLQRTFGATNTSAANTHWKNHGELEGRTAKCPDELTHREAQCYLNKYPDLRGAFGSKNIKKAKTHWHNHGKKEGRNYNC